MKKDGGGWTVGKEIQINPSCYEIKALGVVSEDELALSLSIFLNHMLSALYIILIVCGTKV
jgi:hypothetical protein